MNIWHGICGYEKGLLGVNIIMWNVAYHYEHDDFYIQFYIDNHVESTYGGCPTVFSLSYDSHYKTFNAQGTHISESHLKNLHLQHNNIILILTNSHDQNITTSHIIIQTYAHRIQYYIRNHVGNVHNVCSSELSWPHTEFHIILGIPLKVYPMYVQVYLYDHTAHIIIHHHGVPCMFHIMYTPNFIL